MEPYGRNDLLEIMDDRTERNPTIITAQFPIEHWHAGIGDATIADAVLDRLSHQAHRLNLKGESLRRTKLQKARADQSPIVTD
jgi:DNA replication protein DnaC